MQGAQERLTLARQAFSVGVGMQIEVKRAELDVLEREMELKRLQDQLRRQ
jgi:outer membrane protein TolC